MTTIDEPPLDAASDGDTAPETELVAKKKHSLAVRAIHWINVPVLAIMIYSGMRIYWADLRDPYAIGIGSWTWFEFWPPWVNGPLVLERKLAKGIAWHLTFGWFFVFNGLAYLVYLSRRGRWRYLVPDRQGLRDAPKALLHDLHLRREAPPQGKYNPMQQLVYSSVVVMGVLLIASGFAIYKPVQLSFLVTILGGYDFARAIHFTMTILLMLFFVVHVIQVVRSGWRNFASMITGYRLERRPLEPTAPTAPAAPAGEEVAS